MRSAIWKLSALATVIGLGLVAVVMQQQGLLSAGKPGDKKVATAPDSSTGAKAPSSTANPAATTEAGTDPFTGDGSQPTLDASPLPPESPAVETGAEGAPLQTASVETEQTDPDEEAFTRPTKPRTRPRGLNFKDTVEGDEQTGNEVAQLDNEPATSQRTGDRPTEASNSGSSDPAELEGTAPGDRDQTQLTDESDPFERHRQAQAKARGTGSRTQSNLKNDAGTQDLQSGGYRRQGSSNPFDQGGEAQEESGPIVPVPGATRPRGKLIDNDDSVATESVGSGSPGVGNDPAFEQNEAAPAGYRAETGATARPAKSVSNPRSALTDDEDEPLNAARRPPAATGSPPAVPNGAGARNRPKLIGDEPAGTTGNAPPLPPAGVETIPKISRDPSTETDIAMPPSVSKSGRQRPNPFAEENDGDNALNRQGPTSGSAPAGQDRIETDPNAPTVPAVGPRAGLPKDNLGRPSKNIVDVEPDDRSAFGGSQEAAASRSANTQVLTPPTRISAGPNYPSQGGYAGGGKGQVRIEKLAPQTAYVGQPLIYQIIVRNLGNGSAQQVVVEDPLPEGVTIQGSIPQGELTGRKLLWRVGTLAPKEERKISVKVIPGAAGAIGSAATVKFVADQAFAAADGPDPDANLQTSTTSRTTPRTNSLTTPRTSGGLQLDMQGPQQVGIGKSFEVHFRVTNQSGRPLSNLIVRNTLPDSLQHESGVQDLKYELESLAAGESRDMPITLTASQPGRAVSQIVTTANGEILRTDQFSVDVAGSQVGNPGQRGRGTPFANQSQGAPSLSVEVVSPIGPVQIGGRATYEIRLTSRGTAAVRQSAVRLGIPAELKLVDAGPLNYRQEGSDIIFDAIPTLEPGEKAILKAEFVAQRAGETYLKVQFVGAHMQRPLSREELLQISSQ